jgi:NodT family efflux transporter outer membrane factor (OMF) lipoprotein
MSRTLARRIVLGCSRVALGCSTIAVCACVGPNFHRPAAPVVDHYTAEPLIVATRGDPGIGSEPQRFLEGQDVPRNWWTLFACNELDALVDEALRANPNVASAQATLRQAMENTAAQRGSYFPTVQGAFDATRNRDALGVLSPTLASTTPLYNLFTPQVTVSYVPDLFGGNRRAVESLAAQEESTRFQLDATYLTLTANVVTTAIEEASLRAQIAGTLHVIELERESLAVLQRELDLGAIAQIDVYAQEAALAQLEGTLAPLNKQLHQARDQLAVLTGQLPSEFKPATFELDQLTLPADLPLGVPSQLVERRPDVRAAEAQLHAATAQVGVATANLLPQVTITGSAGSTATMLGDLFKSGTGFWSIGADAAQTLFAGGTLIHRKRAAEAAVDQAAAQYRSAVLTAFQNVADALHALETDADALNAASRATDAAQRTMEAAYRQLHLGSVSYLALVASEQTYSQAVVSLTQARANRYADTAALFQAVGGSVVPIVAR